jgi:hypothetical protein
MSRPTLTRHRDNDMIWLNSIMSFLYITTGINASVSRCPCLWPWLIDFERESGPWLKAVALDRSTSKGDSESRLERTLSGSMDKKADLRELTEFRRVTRFLRPSCSVVFRSFLDKSGLVGSEPEFCFSVILLLWICQLRSWRNESPCKCNTYIHTLNKYWKWTLTTHIPSFW